MLLLKSVIFYKMKDHVYIEEKIKANGKIFLLFSLYLGMEVKHLKSAKRKIVEFAKSIDPDRVAHNELTQLDLHCLPSNLLNLNML